MFKFRWKANETAPLEPRRLDAVKTFEAGGAVGALHDRLRDELGLDWDDPIVYDSKR